MNSHLNVGATPEDDSGPLDRLLVSAFLKSCPDAVWIKDQDCRYITVGQSTAARHGLKPADMIGKTDFELLGEGHPRSDSEIEHVIIRTGKPCIGEPCRETWPDGRVTWVITHKLPLRDIHENIIGTIGIKKDVTALKQAEALLHDSQAFYISLVESLPQYISRKDREGRVTFANQHFCRALGRPFADIAGKTDFDLYPRELAEKYRRDDERVMRERKPFEAVEENIAQDGQHMFVHVIKVPLFDTDARPNGIQCIFWDVTATYRTEAQLAGTQKQLRDASHQAGMAEAATGVLHNVGNVLTSVNVSAEIIADGVRQSRAAENLARLATMLREYQDNLGGFLSSDPKGKLVPGFVESLAKHIHDERVRLLTEIESLQNNINQIKEIVSLQQAYATMVGVVEPLDPATLMEDALRMNAVALVRDAVRIERQFQFVPPVLGERAKILHILVNLVQNAKHACNDHSQLDKVVTLRIEPRLPNHVRFIVEDNGVGIPTENRTRIFEFGFTTRPRGHGFGLHASANAARQMKGSLTVHSDGPGKGAKFTLELPAAPLCVREVETSEDRQCPH